VTSYIESGAGVAEGGRTGLTSVVVGLLFVVALPFSRPALQNLLS
jgi:adenine/guanine/hypoxanthine permease